MKTAMSILVVLSVLAATTVALTQDPPIGGERRESTPEGTPPVTAETLEARFAATLNQATFNGRWCLVQNGKMGPENEDKYMIMGAQKVGGDTWLIRARVQYGERDFVAPVPVQVKWAGDTAVIVVDNLAMPGNPRAYSARVLVYQDTYAGTWSGGDHAGLLMGMIHRAGSEAPPQVQSPP